MSLEAESAALHARVRAFARAALSPGQPSESFDELARAILRFQLAHDSAPGRLARHRGALRSTEDIPAVPADAFRRGRVALHDAASDVVRFQTSGTTGGAGMHAFRSLDTYRELTVAWGRRALLGHLPVASRVTVLALAPPFEPERRSSLGFMLQEFMRAFDGRALSPGAGEFDASEPGRWLVRGSEIDVDGLRAGVELADRRGEPVLLLATSFALVWLLEALGSSPTALPEGSVVMQTGGFKGRSRTLDATELAQRIQDVLSLRAERLVGEYGMTELSSQLYDSGFGSGPSGESVFVPPPWLRVDALDPVSLEPVAAGEAGLARFIDLGNIDSALGVVTQDYVRSVAGGVVLLGRQPRARLRGCSLAIEELRSPRDGGASPGAARTRSVEAADAEPDAVALSRVERLLEATRRAALAGSPARRELVATIAAHVGASAASVEATLEACLELAPSRGELSALVRAVPRSERAHVILPANVFVAAHRALALALAAAPQVFVRPSRRDAGLVRAIWAQTPDLFELVSELPIREGDRVWAYGGDTTLAELRAGLPRGCWLHAHGEGFGVVLVDLEHAALSAAPARAELAAAIALDTARFDQRGCLSPRFVLASGGAERVESFAESLRDALARVEQALPRGRLDRDELVDAAWYQACAACFGPVLTAGHGAVVLRRSAPGVGTFLDVPPIGRHLEIVHAGALDELSALVAALEPWLTTLAVSDSRLEALARRAAPRARLARAGAMQTPPFDGPVDLRADPAGQYLAGGARAHGA